MGLALFCFRGLRFMPTTKKKTGVKRPAKKATSKKAATTGGKPRSARGKLSALLKKFEEQLASGDLRISVADYIRLLQMKREIEGEKVRDVKVTWVEKNASEE